LGFHGPFLSLRVPFVDLRLRDQLAALNLSGPLRRKATTVQQRLPNCHRRYGRVPNQVFSCL
jgi:hypothetical protein